MLKVIKCSILAHLADKRNQIDLHKAVNVIHHIAIRLPQGLWIHFFILLKLSKSIFRNQIFVTQEKLI